MDRKIEKKIFLLIIISALILGGMETVLAKETLPNEHPGIIRFHVIANSDSVEDQQLKLIVKDYVMQKLEKRLAKVISENQGLIDSCLLQESAIIENYIKENLPTIQEWAEDAISSKGYNYNCTIDIGIRHIPAKEYDGMLFPEGNYKALNITIGQGNGQNWWCVVFPPLCLIDAEDSSYRDTFEVGAQDRIILKSKIKEMVTEKTSQENSSIKSIAKGFKGPFTHLTNTNENDSE